MTFRKRSSSRAGFTLPEVLVSVAMVGVLAAVVMPTVIGQVGKSEVSRVIQDVQAVEQAAQMFRTDVGVWPGTLSHLVTEPTELVDLDASGVVYSTSAVAKWNGPYLARGEIAAAGLPTGGGGTVEADLLRAEWTDTEEDYFLAITVSGLTAEEATEVSRAVDGGEEATPLLSGKVRFATPTEILTFFGVPFK